MNEREEIERLHEWEELVVQEREAFYRSACWRLGNAEDAEDVVQEVLCDLFCSRSDLKQVHKLRSYILRAIANRCCDRLRARSKRRFTGIDRAAALVDEEMQTAYVEADRIGKLLDKLPNAQAEVIRMRTFDNLGFGEIARTLRCPEATIKSRFRYGVEKLRGMLNPIKNQM